MIESQSEQPVEGGIAIIVGNLRFAFRQVTVYTRFPAMDNSNMLVVSGR